MIHLIPTKGVTNLAIDNKYVDDNGLRFFEEPTNKEVDYQIVIITKNERLWRKSELDRHSYYYIKNHYNEWYIGKFDGDSFNFIDDGGNFDSTLFTCKRIIASNSEKLTPFFLISNSDLKYICDYHNTNK